MSCQQVPTAPAFNPYPRSVQVGEFEVAIDGGVWVAIGGRLKAVKRRQQSGTMQTQSPNERRAILVQPINSCVAGEVGRHRFDAFLNRRAGHFVQRRHGIIGRAIEHGAQHRNGQVPRWTRMPEIVGEFLLLHAARPFQCDSSMNAS